MLNGSDSKGRRVVRHVADAKNTKGRQVGYQGQTQAEAKGEQRIIETLAAKQRNAGREAKSCSKYFWSI